MKPYTLLLIVTIFPIECLIKNCWNVIFSPEDTIATNSIDIIDDSIFKGNENFDLFIVIQALNNVTGGCPTKAKVVIIDNENSTYVSV